MKQRCDASHLSTAQALDGLQKTNAVELLELEAQQAQAKFTLDQSVSSQLRQMRCLQA
ncbi:hypothetical protein M413DRAFT_449661 [Hebeloma cylindrosporum]|uniref:Uncharacterized protein n=1 Tax=Hebeloma cylindrosporum TaxID=76867 RepID=A0A0C3BW55_HEBCY|nr:hypothetical protein M413DRAFT_449661 [Hebeloma cylindrosporum h7]